MPPQLPVPAQGSLMPSLTEAKGLVGLPLKLSESLPPATSRLHGGSLQGAGESRALTCMQTVVSPASDRAAAPALALAPAPALPEEGEQVGGSP